MANEAGNRNLKFEGRYSRNYARIILLKACIDGNKEAIDELWGLVNFTSLTDDHKSAIYACV